MTRPWLGSFATVMMMLLACGDDVDESADTGDSSDSGSSTNPTTDPTMTDPTIDPSDDGPDSTGVDTGTDTGTVDTGSTGGSSGGSETTDAETDTSGTDSTGDSSSSGEPPVDDYPSCMADDECTDPYTLCWPPADFGDPNFCTLECADAKECPVPSSGAAVPVCEGPPDTNVCVLDCSEGECPDGMDCVDIFGNGAFLRCTRA